MRDHPAGSPRTDPTKGHHSVTDAAMKWVTFGAAVALAALMLMEPPADPEDALWWVWAWCINIAVVALMVGGAGWVEAREQAEREQFSRRRGRRP